MNFLNDPKYRSIKVLCLLAVIVISGAFIYHFAANSNSGPEEATVVNGTNKITYVPTTTFSLKHTTFKPSNAASVMSYSPTYNITYTGNTCSVSDSSQPGIAPVMGSAVTEAGDNGGEGGGQHTQIGCYVSNGQFSIDGEPGESIPGGIYFFKGNLPVTNLGKGDSPSLGVQ